MNMEAKVFNREEFERMLKELDNLEESIKKTARYVSRFNQNEDQITKILMAELEKAPRKNKINFLYLQHEIFLNTKSNTDLFVKSFGTHLKTTMTQVVDSLDTTSECKAIFKIIEIWTDLRLYVPSFHEKLKKIVTDRITQLKESGPDGNNTASKGEVKGEAKISKTFIRDYNLVQEHPNIKALYELKMKEDEYKKKAEELTKLFDKKAFEERLSTIPNPFEVTGDITKCKRMADECKVMLIEILQQYANNYVNFKTTLEGEINDWAAFNFDTHEKYKSLLEKLRE